MQDIIHALASLLAILQVTNIAFNEGELRPLLWADRRFYFIQIVPVARCEIIETYYLLIKL
jgi:hypothetical protein